MGAGHAPTVVYSNIQGAWPGLGNIDVEPLFARPNSANNPLDPDAIWLQADYHLLSETGRWNPPDLRWVADPLTSPCIDAGDPDSPWSGEPQAHGARLNLGAYGGTEQASGSHRVVSTVARWTLDASSGSRAFDTVGNNHATIHGATRTAGILNGALQFDGVDDYLDCGNDPVLAPDQFTISMWIHPQADSISRYILRKAGNDKDKDYEFELFGARHPTFSFGDGFQSVVLYAGTKLPLNEWTHVTLTRGQTEAAIYINGSQLIGQSYDFAPVPTGQNLIIGGGSLQPYQGKIDDVRIYDSVLFTGEIGNLVDKVNSQITRQ